MMCVNVYIKNNCLCKSSWYSKLKKFPSERLSIDQSLIFCGFA